MSSGDTPAVARRRVRLAIRDARNSKGFTQSQVAEAMDWSLSKVMRIESGEVTISQNDLRPLLGYLGIRDKKRVEELVTSAKASRQRRQWWDGARFQDNVTAAMKQMFRYEAEATVMRHFAAVSVPGLLQTEAYARALMWQYEHEMTAEQISARIETRSLRRAGLLQREKRPTVFVLLDESVLKRTIGGAHVLREQLAELRKAIDAGWLVARINLFISPYPSYSSYEILYLDAEDAEHAVLYRETHLFDEIIDDPAKIAQHWSLWDQGWSAAVSENESLSMIESRMLELA